MKTLMLTLFACSMAACAVDPVDQLDDDAIGTDEQSIIGGTTDNGDPSVVALFVHAPGATSGSLCTGTVISSRAVLTAAHCVDPQVVGSGQVFEVLTGTTLAGPRLAVASTAFDPAFHVNNLTAGHDIAVVRLAAATTLPAIPYNRGALGTGAVRLVGYGTSTHSNAGAGTKRQVRTTLAASSNLLARIGSSSQQTCHGDSGGPAFQTIGGREVIIGVTSFGSDNSATSVCFGGGTDTRVNAFTAFIDSHL